MGNLARAGWILHTPTRDLCPHPPWGQGDPGWERSRGLPARCQGAGSCPAVTARRRSALDTRPLPGRLPFPAALCRQGPGRVSRCRQRREGDGRRHSGPDQGTIPCVSQGPSAGTPSNRRHPLRPLRVPRAALGAGGPSGASNTAGEGGEGPGAELERPQGRLLGAMGVASTQAGVPVGTGGAGPPMCPHTWLHLRAQRGRGRCWAAPSSPEVEVVRGLTA